MNDKSYDIVEVGLYAYGLDDECKAYVIAGDGLKIRDFRVKKGLGNGVQVYMPTWMHTTWAFPQLEWAYVRNVIADEYKREQNEKALEAQEPQPYTLEPASQTAGANQYNGYGRTFEGYGNHYGGQRGGYNQRTFGGHRGQYGQHGYNQYGQYQTQGRSSRPARSFQVTFYSRQILNEYNVNIKLKDLNLWINGFCLNYNTTSGTIWVGESQNFDGYLMKEAHLDPHAIYQVIKDEFKRKFLHDLSYPENPDIITVFEESHMTTSYLVDVTLPGRNKPMKGFRLYVSGENLKVVPPSWINKWEDKGVSWHTLCTEIRAAYFKQRIAERITLPEPTYNKPYGQSGKKAKKHQKPYQKQWQQDLRPEEPEDNETTALMVIQLPENLDDYNIQEEVTVEPVKPAAHNHNSYGRVMNSGKSPWHFYPNSIIRLEKKDKDNDSKLYKVALALAKGNHAGGIGPIDLTLLKAIEGFRYITNSMLLDLLGTGHIRTPWEDKQIQKKLTQSLNKMGNLNLVKVSHFVSLEDDGYSYNLPNSNLRILSIGNAGHILLQETGNPSRYSNFDVLRESGFVTSTLSANQWLVWWIANYGEHIGRDYKTQIVVFDKQKPYSGGRVFATFNLNGKTFVGEPVRRCEEDQKEEAAEELRGKFSRLNELFKDTENLFLHDQHHQEKKAGIKENPVIVYICEDEDHRGEVYEQLKTLLEENPDRQVWFTTDLDVFNYDVEGPRFMRATTEGLEPVSLEDELGLEIDEVEPEIETELEAETERDGTEIPEQKIQESQDEE